MTGMVFESGDSSVGAAAILFGVIGLVWDDFAAVWQPVPGGMAHRGALAYLAATLFLCSGTAAQLRCTRAAGALVLSVLYVPYALLWLRRAIGFLELIGRWSGAAEQVAPVTAGLMTYAQFGGEGRAWTRRMAVVCRVLFGMCFVALALAHFIAVKETATSVPKWMPGDSDSGRLRRACFT